MPTLVLHSQQLRKYYLITGHINYTLQIASLEWCKGPDRSLPLPDAVFYLHLPSDSAQERPNFGNERYEKKAFQEVVYQTKQ